MITEERIEKLEQRIGLLEKKVNESVGGQVIRIQAERWSISRYAKHLGISRNTVYAWEEKGLIEFEKGLYEQLVKSFPANDDGSPRYPTYEDWNNVGVYKHINMPRRRTGS